MFLEPSDSPVRRHRSTRGFTLIELVVVVLIIGISAALATPTVVEQMRERRAQDMAQQVAQFFSVARMRAMGRGSAVLVTYKVGVGFEAKESIEGALATARGSNDCTAAPGLGCLTTTWGVPANERFVGSLKPPPTMLFSGPADNFGVCFTPSGRTFVSYTSAPPVTPMATVVTFKVTRNVANPIEREVVLLPGGSARLAL